MSERKTVSGGSAPSGPSPQYAALLEGRISSKEYVRQLKERVDAERSAEMRAVRRSAARLKAEPKGEEDRRTW